MEHTILLLIHRILIAPHETIKFVLLLQIRKDVQVLIVIRHFCKRLKQWM